MSGIFISYRRSDSAGHTGRLADDLRERLDGQALFRDIEGIEAGVDFVHALEKAVGACAVMLVVIGPTWASASSADGQRRLHQPGDFVRMEIEAALARDIRVIPVLVGDAVMPGPADVPESMAGLLRRNAYAISDRRWHYDVTQLLEILVKIPGVAALKSGSMPAAPAQPATVAPQPAHGGIPRWLKAVLAGIGILATVSVALNLADKRQQPPAQDAGAPAAAPRPAPAESPFYGDWVSADGKVFNINVDDEIGKVYVWAGSRMDDGTGGGVDTPPPNAPGQDIYGNGEIDGRRLQARLTDAYSKEEYALEFELSDDATTLSGTFTNSATGEARQLSLRQR